MQVIALKIAVINLQWLLNSFLILVQWRLNGSQYTFCLFVLLLAKILVSLYSVVFAQESHFFIYVLFVLVPLIGIPETSPINSFFIVIVQYKIKTKRLTNRIRDTIGNISIPSIEVI